jgi:hypothetical protein
MMQPPIVSMCDFTSLWFRRHCRRKSLAVLGVKRRRTTQQKLYLPERLRLTAHSRMPRRPREFCQFRQMCQCIFTVSTPRKDPKDELLVGLPRSSEMQDVYGV